MANKLTEILQGLGILGALLSRLKVGRVILGVVGVVERLIQGHSAVDKLKRRAYIAVQEQRGINLDAAEAEQLARLFRLLDEINAKVEARGEVVKSDLAARRAAKRARKAAKLAANLERKARRKGQ